MSWRERDYSHAWRGEAGALGRHLRVPPPISLTLVVLHAVALVALAIASDEVGGWIALQGTNASLLGILLHPLASRSFLSVAITILIIWSLAGAMERHAGGLRVLVLYVAGNLVAGGGYFALARLWPAWATVPLDYPAGAMAAWCVAAWKLFADQPVSLFGRMHSAARVTLIAAVVVVALMLLLGGVGALAWGAAIVIGALTGWLIQVLPGVTWPRPRLRWRRRPASWREEAPPPRQRPAVSAEPNVDEILAKISRSGLASLTPAERARLEAARMAMLRQSER